MRISSNKNFKSRHLQTFCIFLFLTLGASCQDTLSHKCSEYIENFPSYKCRDEDPFHYSRKSTLFLIVKSNQLYSFKVQVRSMESINEINILYKVSICPGISPLQEYLILDKVVMLIVPYFRLGTLKEVVLDEDLSLGTNQKMRIFEKLVESLVCIHKFDIIHMDLHFENVVFNYNLEPYIIDFNNSTFAGDMEVPSFISHFRSPEIVHSFNANSMHRFSLKDDIYSMGVLLYFILKGRLPLEDHNFRYHVMITEEILLDKQDYRDVIDILKASLVVQEQRLSTVPFDNLVRAKLEKPSGEQLKEMSYYTLENPVLMPVGSNKSMVVATVLLIAFVFTFLLVVCFLMYCRRCCQKMFSSVFKPKTKRKAREYLFDDFDKA